jgi:hypothetical protein
MDGKDKGGTSQVIQKPVQTASAAGLSFRDHPTVMDRSIATRNQAS